MGHNIHILMGILAGVIQSQDGLYLSFYFNFSRKTICTMWKPKCKSWDAGESVVIERKKLDIELQKI